MLAKSRNYPKPLPLSFNMTAVIDIVFLLIVFFVVTFQFIGGDSTAIDIPDKCDAALKGEVSLSPVINVAGLGQGQMSYIVGSQQIEASDKNVLVEQMTRSLNEALASLPEDKRIVVLRIDKKVQFSQAKYALAAAANSQAKAIKLAALSETNP